MATAHPQPTGTAAPDSDAPDARDPSDEKRKRRLAVAIPVFFVGLAALAAAARAQNLGSSVIVIGFVVLEAVMLVATVWTQNRGHDTWQPFAGLLVGALLLLPPEGVVVALVLGAFAGYVLTRTRAYALAFNVGHIALSVWLSASAFDALRGTPDFTLRVVGAALAAVVIDTVVNEILYGIFVKVVDGRPFGRTVWSGLVFAATRMPPVVAMGLLAGAAGTYVPWAAMLALPPMAAFQVALAEHVRALRDRERITGLLNAANSAHASVRTDEVERAVLRAAAELLRCDAATIEAHEPRNGWGVELSGEMAGKWLVVRRRVRDAALEGQERDLLNALAAIGSSALGNAQLVEQIEHQAFHDALTGLANQALFEDRVAQAAANSRRTHERFAVLVLDLDSFKKVNDSLGHSQGNELLRLVGDRLVGATRDTDTVARLGADHFTLLLPGLGDPDSAAVMAETVLAAVRRPVMLDGHELFMTASVGIAFFPEDGTQPDHLLRNADSAMHRAKEIRDTFQTYASGMNEQAHMRLVRESELHNAIERNELRLHYQPQVDLRTGRMVGVEALVRWDHPVLGLIAPHEFVPLAEESGLIVQVDTWVLGEACRQLRRWSDLGIDGLRVSINLSGRHFQAPERLIESLKRAIATTQVDPSLIEVEVTESVAVGEEGTALALQHVRELGVQVAIDDFGTGYSMLARLQHFPIDRLKIDQSFVSQIRSAHDDAPIVAAIIAMARSLKMEVVAEGVETLDQQTFLRNHGCDSAQGFLFSKAVTADQIAPLARSRSLGFNVGTSA